MDNFDMSITPYKWLTQIIRADNGKKSEIIIEETINNDSICKTYRLQHGSMITQLYASADGQQVDINTAWGIAETFYVVSFFRNHVLKLRGKARREFWDYIFKQLDLMQEELN